MRIIFILIAPIYLFSCKEEKISPATSCLGVETFYLTANDKKLVIIKDTTYVFKDAATDTIRVKLRKFIFDFYTATEICDCGGPNTETTGERGKSYYIFGNKNIACWYETAAVRDNKVGFDIFFGDTNYVVNNTNSNPGQISQFWIGNIGTHPNNYDSLSINGKYYYNVISTYEHQSLSVNSYVSQCFYARNFGIIRFKLNGVIYDILN